MKVNILKPGLLVALSVRVAGGVSYRRIELEAEHDDGAGGLLARWETVKYVPDPDEFARATMARSKARALVSGVCCPSTFGLLCPNSEEPKLLEAIEEARRVASAFNATSGGSRLEVFVLVGRIAQDDAEAARAIGTEVRDLLQAMQDGVKAADVDAIRDAANKARALGGMLAADVAGKVNAAIEEARKVAREMAKRIEKGGEQAAAVVSELKLRAIEEARFAFLDLDAGTVTSAAPIAPAVELDTVTGGDGEVRASPLMSLPLQLEV